MGLDMYLRKRIYIGAHYEHRNVKGTIELTESEEDKPIQINVNKVSEIIEEVAYWRKANHIHKWFVDNVQKGEDNCGEYYVSKENLQKLYDDCLEVRLSTTTEEGVIKNGENLKDGVWMPNFENGKVLKDSTKAEELLPTTSGFFFGGTDYDEYYMQDVEYTLGVLKELLEQDYNGSIYYSSSW